MERVTLHAPFLAGHAGVALGANGCCITLVAASVANVANNISEVDREQLYGLESLHLDLCGELGGCGSSCGGEPGCGWVPAAGETHMLACG